MTTPNICLAILGVMIALLFAFPRLMMTITATTALCMIAICGPMPVESTAAHLLTVLLVMSATQLAVHRIFESGAEARLCRVIGSLATHPFFFRVPATILLPAVFVPTTWIMAAILHNVTAIAIAVPLVSRMSRRFGIDPLNTFCALLVASNLGGASTAFGDGPAIMQREFWGFSPAVFAAAMVPRNLVQVAILTLVTAALTWWPTRKTASNWTETYRRLKLRGQMERGGLFRDAVDNRPALLAALVLLAFIGLQFVFPSGALQLSALALLTLILLVPEGERADAFMVLGLEPIVVIASLFTIASTVQRTPLFSSLASLVMHPGHGHIELTAYFATLAISADGAAAALVQLVHGSSNGSVLSAWQLAGGICAGSSALLTSASAGPIIYALVRLHGHELSFRRYAAFGIPFSIVMIVVSILFNMVAGGGR
jgi:Na+/H+ antiporter NhaD/arsenite permease-like protein